ncbi:hypothetical protein DBR06_SOUSAS5010056, partial [Sousa chinensis]
IEGHEAIALCSTASEQNTLEQAEKALLAVVELLKDPKVAASLQKLSGKQLKTLKVKSQVKHHTKRISALTPNAISLFAVRGPWNITVELLLPFLPPCVSTTESVHHGEAPCSVAMAPPLDGTTRSELEVVLSTPVNIHVKARSWKLEVTTEPPTTGGMTVHTGQKYTVMSAKTMIQKLSRAMQEVV